MLSMMIIWKLLVWGCVAILAGNPPANPVWMNNLQQATTNPNRCWCQPQLLLVSGESWGRLWVEELGGPWSIEFSNVVFNFCKWNIRSRQIAGKTYASARSNQRKESSVQPPDPIHGEQVTNRNFICKDGPAWRSGTLCANIRCFWLQRASVNNPHQWGVQILERSPPRLQHQTKKQSHSRTFV